MKTILIILGYIFLAVYFTACAGAGGGSSAKAAVSGPTTTTAPIVYQYDYVITGNGGSVAWGVYTNFGDPDQTYSAPGIVAVGASGIDFKVYGRNTVYQIVNQGSVPLQVVIYKDGPPYSTQTPINSFSIPVGQNVNSSDGI